MSHSAIIAEKFGLPTNALFEKLYALEPNKNFSCRYYMRLLIERFDRNQYISFVALLLSGSKYKTAIPTVMREFDSHPLEEFMNRMAKIVPNRVFLSPWKLAFTIRHFSCEGKIVSVDFNEPESSAVSITPEVTEPEIVAENVAELEIVPEPVSAPAPVSALEYVPINAAPPVVEKPKRKSRSKKTAAPKSETAADTETAAPKPKTTRKQKKVAEPEPEEILTTATFKPTKTESHAEIVKAGMLSLMESAVELWDEEEEENCVNWSKMRKRDSDDEF